MYNFIPFSKAETAHRGGFSLSIFIPKAAMKGFNALLVKLGGEHPKKKMIDTTRIYFVKNGKGTFIIDDNEYPAVENTVFTIEPNQTYSYKGEMELFEVNISPNNSFTDKLV